MEDIGGDYLYWIRECIEMIFSTDLDKLLSDTR